MFTTDGALAGEDLVLLRDDRHLQPARTVTPIVRADTLERFGGGVRAALDAVSDTAHHGGPPRDERLSVGGRRPARAVATAWLEDHGLGTPGVASAATRRGYQRTRPPRNTHERRRRLLGPDVRRRPCGEAPPLPRDLGRSGKFWLTMVAYFVATVIGVLAVRAHGEACTSASTPRSCAGSRRGAFEPSPTVMEGLALLSSRWVTPGPPLGHDHHPGRRPSVAPAVRVPRGASSPRRPIAYLDDACSSIDPGPSASRSSASGRGSRCRRGPWPASP